MSEKVKFTVDEVECKGMHVTKIDTDLDDFDDCHKCVFDGDCPSGHVKGNWIYCYVEHSKGCFGFAPIPKPRPQNVDPAKCAWREDEVDGGWITQCGEKHEFTNDGPKANHHRFCPYCGKALIESR
jgi:hypothetical protein